MWILSQNGFDLLNANYFFVDSYTYKDKTEYYIRASIVEFDNSIIVAEYSTREKAKYVFNCLIDRIHMTSINRNVEFGVYKSPYKLPKDDEVNYYEK